MHYKQKNKLLKTTKLYTTMYNGSVEKQTTTLRCQIGTKDYVIFDLYDTFPDKLEFISLSPKGFDYKVGVDDPIIVRGRKETLKILQNSKQIKDININTIDEVILLVNQMTEGNLQWN